MQDKIDTEKNWEEIKKELMGTQRQGVDKLIDYLEKSDFRTCPASTKFHLCVEGGLVQHSLNVLKYARVVTKELGLSIPDTNIVISALLHDLCKVNYYILGEEWDKEWKDKTNQWRKKSVWKVEDKLPLGHGEKSAIIASSYIDLTPDEVTAIRWHMSGFEPGIHFHYPVGASFRQAMDSFPLAKVIILADQMAEFYESYHSKTSDSL